MSRDDIKARLHKVIEDNALAVNAHSPSNVTKRHVNFGAFAAFRFHFAILRSAQRIAVTSFQMLHSGCGIQFLDTARCAVRDGQFAFR